MDDGTLLRLGKDNFRWIGGDDYGGIWLREEAKRLGYKVWIKSSTDQLHNIAVQGSRRCGWLRPVRLSFLGKPFSDILLNAFLHRQRTVFLDCRNSFRRLELGWIQLPSRLILC